MYATKIKLHIPHQISTKNLPTLHFFEKLHVKEIRVLLQTTCWKFPTTKVFTPFPTILAAFFSFIFSSTFPNTFGWNLDVLPESFESSLKIIWFHPHNQLHLLLGWLFLICGTKAKMLCISKGTLLGSFRSIFLLQHWILVCITFLNFWHDILA